MGFSPCNPPTAFMEAARGMFYYEAVTVRFPQVTDGLSNTIMLGAFARTTWLVSLDALRFAVEHSSFRDAGLRQNLEALAAGYENTQVHRLERKAAA